MSKCTRGISFLKKDTKSFYKRWVILQCEHSLWLLKFNLHIWSFFTMQMSHVYINYSYIKICVLSTAQFPYTEPRSFQDLDAPFNCFSHWKSLQRCCEKEHDTVTVSVLKKDPSLYVFQEKTITHSCDFGGGTSNFLSLWQPPYQHPKCVGRFKRPSVQEAYSAVSTT